MASRTLTPEGPPTDVASEDRVELVTHSVDTVWLAWQYQLDRTREFLVLLTAIAGGLFALTLQEGVQPAFLVLGALLGVLLCAYWAYLNERWAGVIRVQTNALFELAKRSGLIGSHAYLSPKAYETWLARSSSRSRLRTWWMSGTLGFPLVYGAFYVVLLAYLLLARPWT